MLNKKTIAVILSVVLLIALLSGCGKDQKEATETEEDTSLQSAYAYKATFYPVKTHLEEEVRWVNGICVSGDKVYYSGSYLDGMIDAVDELTGEPLINEETGETVQYENYVSGIFCFDPSTKTVSLLEGYTPAPVPEGMMGSSNINQILPGKDGSIWIYEELYTYYFDLPESFDPETDMAYDYYVQGDQPKILSQYSASGELLKSVTLELDSDVYIGSLFVTPDDIIVAYDYNDLYLFDESGALTKKLSQLEVNGNLTQLSSGEIVCTAYDETTQGRVLKKLDLAQGAFVDAGTLPSDAYDLYSGVEPYDYLYRMNDSVFGYQEASQTSEKLFSWLDCDVNSNNVERFNYLSDGRIVALEVDHMSGQMESNLILLEQVDASTLPEKQELTLGCMNLDWDLRNSIVAFNRSNQDTRIVVRDYSEYITVGDYETSHNAAIQKLTTEILSGSAPDILCTDGLPVEQYIAKDILMDLWPLIDSDPELSREDLMGHFFDCLSVDGKLYQVTDTFSIQTAVVHSDIADGRTSWTLDELLEARDNLQPGASIFGAYDTSDYMLQTMISYDLGQFVDWENGTCSFDSPEFIDILNFANQFPKEFDSESYDWETEDSEYTRLKNGKQLMMNGGLHSFDDVQFHSGIFDGKASYIGFPTSSGSGSCFSCYGCLAISSSCKNVDAAWSLVRTLLLEENQVEEYMYNFPTNRHAFEVYKKQEMTPEYTTDEETGEQVEVSTGGIGFNDFMVELYSVKQEDFDAFWSVYENCSRVASSNNEIMDIINDHTPAFFDGQKTAEETAALIQDGVSLYLMEQG